MNKKDLLVIGGVLLIALIGFFGVRTFQKQEASENYVNIYVKDVLYKQVSLDDPQLVEIEVDGKYNAINITEQGVVMQEANCDNQNCIHQGEVSLENIDNRLLGGWILCLPNQVTIEMVTGEDQ